MAHEAISLNTLSILHAPASFVHINKASSTCIQLVRVFNGLFMDKPCLFKSVQARTRMEHWKKCEFVRTDAFLLHLLEKVNCLVILASFHMFY
jgi:hypothetical protein